MTIYHFTVGLIHFLNEEILLYPFVFDKSINE